MKNRTDRITTNKNGKPCWKLLYGTHMSNFSQDLRKNKCRYFSNKSLRFREIKIVRIIHADYLNIRKGSNLFIT